MPVVECLDSGATGVHTLQELEPLRRSTEVQRTVGDARGGRCVVSIHRIHPLTLLGPCDVQLPGGNGRSVSYNHITLRDDSIRLLLSSFYPSSKGGHIHESHTRDSVATELQRVIPLTWIDEAALRSQNFMVAFESNFVRVKFRFPLLTVTRGDKCRGQLAWHRNSQAGKLSRCEWSHFCGSAFAVEKLAPSFYFKKCPPCICEDHDVTNHNRGRASMTPVPWSTRERSQLPFPVNSCRPHSIGRRCTPNSVCQFSPYAHHRSSIIPSAYVFNTELFFQLSIHSRCCLIRLCQTNRHRPRYTSVRANPPKLQLRRCHP